MIKPGEASKSNQAEVHRQLGQSAASSREFRAKRKNQFARLPLFAL